MEHNQHHTFSLAARRQAAEGLPPFDIPQIPPDQAVPRGGGGFSPGQSSVHTTSSHSSQPPQTMTQQYTLGHGQVQNQVSASGPWTSAPAQNGGSIYTTAAPVHPNPYNHVQNHRQHSLGHLSHRGPQSPLGFPNDPLAGTAYGEAETRAYQPPVHAAHHPSLPPHLPSQAPSLQTPATALVSQQGTPAHAAAHSNGGLHLDTFNQYRTASGNSFPMGTSASPQGTYPSFAPQASPSQQSPTGLVTPRAASAGGSGGYGQSAPASMPATPFRNYNYYSHQGPQSPLAAMTGHNLTTMTQHGGQMGVLPGIAQQNPQGPYHMYHGGPPVPLDRPFKCDQCTQCFSRNHDLKRHKRIHLEVKPFSCDFCTKQFSRKDALKRHRLVKGCEDKERQEREAAEKETPSDSDNPPLPPVRPTTDGPYHRHQ